MRIILKLLNLRQIVVRVHLALHFRKINCTKREDLCAVDAHKYNERRIESFQLLAQYIHTILVDKCMAYYIFI